MKGLKNVIMGFIILPPIIFLSSAETKFPKAFAKPLSTKNTSCVEKVVDKITLRRLLDKYLFQPESERTDFKRDYYLILL